VEGQNVYGEESEYEVTDVQVYESPKAVKPARR
jgi:hypothetical protein